MVLVRRLSETGCLVGYFLVKVRSRLIGSRIIFGHNVYKEYTRGYWKFRDDRRSSFRDITKRLEGGGKNSPSPPGRGLTRAPVCVRVFEHPPMRFFVNNVKTAPAVFGTHYHTSFPHMLWKFQTQVTQGQVTRSRQLTSPHKKFECSSTLHWLNDCLETFSDCYKQQCL